jgi:hypothetical protein
VSFVHTAHGLGKVVEEHNSRGRKSYKVEGDGFSVWLDEKDLRFGTVDSTGIPEINKDNETTLPYNPDPQWPVQMFQGPKAESTIQPIHQIDPDKRTSPSKSLDFSKGETRPAPGPNPDQFAKSAHYTLEPEPPHGESMDVGRHWAPGEGESYGGPKLAPGGGKHEPHPIKDKLRGLGQGLSRGLGLDIPEPQSWAEERSAQYRPAGLSKKYVEIQADVDHWNPIQQFRDDPHGFINRHAYLNSDDHVDIRLGEYLDLLEHDPHIREAAWRDVRSKAMRLRQEGAVHVQDIGPDRIYAMVDGDNGQYETMIAKTGGLDQSISNWSCTCDWGKHAFTREATYVGRLCSHGYAAYLEMQSQHIRQNPEHPLHHRTAGVVDDFKKWVQDENQGHVDVPAMDQFVSLQNQEEPQLSREDVEELYDYINNDKVQKVPERNYDIPYLLDTDKAYKEADALRTHPESLSPDFQFAEPQGQHWTDVEEDDRKTTAPDQIVHFSGRYAADGGEVEEIPEFRDFEGQGALLNRLRDEIEDSIEDDLGDMDARNDRIRSLVEDLHEKGCDANNLVAHLIQAADYGYEEHPWDDKVEWPNKAFAGTGPAEKYHYESSDAYVDRNERPRFKSVDDLDGDIIKYTDEKPQQGPRREGSRAIWSQGYPAEDTLQIWAARYFKADDSTDPWVVRDIVNPVGNYLNNFNNEDLPGMPGGPAAGAGHPGGAAGGSATAEAPGSLGAEAPLPGAINKPMAGGHTGDSEDPTQPIMPGQSGQGVQGGGAPNVGVGAPVDYSVQPGDTLSGIAQSQGLGGGYQDIVKANPGNVGTSGTNIEQNPNMIHPGDTLHIPGGTGGGGGGGAATSPGLPAGAGGAGSTTKDVDFGGKAGGGTETHSGGGNAPEVTFSAPKPMINSSRNWDRWAARYFLADEGDDDSESKKPEQNPAPTSGGGQPASGAPSQGGFHMPELTPGVNAPWHDADPYMGQAGGQSGQRPTNTSSPYPQTNNASPDQPGTQQNHYPSHPWGGGPYMPGGGGQNSQDIPGGKALEAPIPGWASGANKPPPGPQDGGPRPPGGQQESSSGGGGMPSGVGGGHDQFNTGAGSSGGGFGGSGLSSLLGEIPVVGPMISEFSHMIPGMGGGSSSGGGGFGGFGGGSGGGGGGLSGLTNMIPGLGGGGGFGGFKASKDPITRFLYSDMRVGGDDMGWMGAGGGDMNAPQDAGAASATPTTNPIAPGAQDIGMMSGASGGMDMSQGIGNLTPTSAPASSDGVGGGGSQGPTSQAVARRRRGNNLPPEDFGNDGNVREAARTDDNSDVVAAFQRMGGIDAVNGNSAPDDERIAASAKGFLRTAGRNYSFAEQRELEDESHVLGARNLDGLDLRGTHYEDL